MTPRLLLLLPLLAVALPAQSRPPLTGADCGNPIGKACEPRILTEATFSSRVLTSQDRQRDPYFYNYSDNSFHYAMALGLVAPVAPRIGVGGIVSAGVRESGLYLLMGPRFRYHLSATTALDVTPGYMLEREQSIVGPVMLDAAVTYKNTVGLSAQLSHGTLTYWTPDDPNVKEPVTTLHVGARLGGTAGLLGIGSGVLAAIAAIAILVTYGVGS